VRLADAPQIDAEATRSGLVAGRPALLVASTSAGEEALILRAWLTQPRPDWQIILCPRHPERGAELVDLCRSLGLEAVRSAAGERLPRGPAVLIVDEIGRLGALYGWCARSQGLAIVGGSLGSGRGGQNMFEAAAAACATVVGWDTRSQPDSMSLLRACAGVVELRPGSVSADLQALADDSARRLVLGAAGHRAWLAGQGATARHMAAIAPIIRASLHSALASLPPHESST
jgi:3-deoxy-D-manno-octulosonic-acid transferase